MDENDPSPAESTGGTTNTVEASPAERTVDPKRSHDGGATPVERRRPVIAIVGVLIVVLLIGGFVVLRRSGSSSDQTSTGPGPNGSPNGSSPGGSAAGPSPSTAPGPPVKDAFDRPNGPALGNTITGEKWEAVAGTWGVRDKQAYVAKINDKGPRDYAVVDLGRTDGSVQAKAAHVVEGWGLTFRMKSVSAWWAVTASTQAGTFSVVKFQEGKEVPVGNIGLVEAADATIRVEFVGDLITVFVNDKATKTFQDAYLQAEGTRVGLFATGKEAPEARWSDFEAKRGSSGPPTTAAVKGNAAAKVATKPAAPPSTTPEQRGAPLDPASVKRVLLFGDSAMWGEWQPVYGKLQPRGIDVRYAGLGVSGPLWNDKQWARWLDEQLQTFHPQIVVIEACCVYPGWAHPTAGGGQLYVTPDGKTVEPDSELMFTEWRKAVQELVDKAKASGAAVWLANMPEPAPYAVNTYDKALVDRTSRLRREYFSLNTPIIDWGESVAGAPNEVELRDEDGIHLSVPGSLVVADQTIKRILG